MIYLAPKFQYILPQKPKNKIHQSKIFKFTSYIYEKTPIVETTNIILGLGCLIGMKRGVLPILYRKIEPKLLNKIHVLLEKINIISRKQTLKIKSLSQQVIKHFTTAVDNPNGINGEIKGAHTIRAFLRSCFNKNKSKTGEIICIKKDPFKNGVYEVQYRSLGVNIVLKSKISKITRIDVDKIDKTKVIISYIENNVPKQMAININAKLTQKQAEILGNLPNHENLFYEIDQQGKKIPTEFAKIFKNNTRGKRPPENKEFDIVIDYLFRRQHKSAKTKTILIDTPLTQSEQEQFRSLLNLGRNNTESYTNARIISSNEDLYPMQNLITSAENALKRGKMVSLGKEKVVIGKHNGTLFIGYVSHINQRSGEITINSVFPILHKGQLQKEILEILKKSFNNKQDLTPEDLNLFIGMIDKIPNNLFLKPLYKWLKDSGLFGSYICASSLAKNELKEASTEVSTI